MGNTLLLLACAALAGASGLGLEVLGTNLAGLTLGYGRSGPIAIALFIAGWALGARLAGGWQSHFAARLVLVGLWLCACAAVGPFLFQRLAASGIGDGWGALLCSLMLLAVAIPQGVFLPLLTRGLGTRAGSDVSWLFAANLLGAALGSWTLGSVLPAAFGQASASLAAGGCALVAACLAALVLRAASPEPEAQASAPVSLLGAGLILAGVTAWAAALEWFGVRLAVLWLGGMQDVLGSVLVATLLALGLGAALVPRLLPNSRRGLVLLAGLCGLSSLTYFCVPWLLSGSQEQPLLLRSVRLVGLALLPFGAWVPMLYRVSGGKGPRQLGRLLGYEALGALIGLPLMHFLVLPAVGLGGAVVAMVLAACVALVLADRRSPLSLGVGGLTAVLAWAALAQVGKPVLHSPPLQNPAFEVLSVTEDAHFAVCVVQDGLLGERTLMTDGFRAAASGRDYAYMRALAHLPLLMHPSPKRVGVLAFGTGTTAGAVSLHETPESIDILELSRSVTDNAHWFEEVNRGVLQDERVELFIGDGRHTLRRHPGRYDVLTMEPLLPDSPFAVYLYTSEFYESARRSLAPGGLLCQWVPPHALEPETFDAVLAAFTSAFDWSGIWVFGTQVILLGGEALPQPDTRRFPAGDSDLRRALAGLGLQDVEGVLGRFVLAGSAWPAVERPLRDLDPWVIYSPRRRGSALLTDLPLNLSKLRGLAQPLPVEWLVGLRDGAQARFDALALLREARESYERGRARGSLSAELESGRPLSRDLGRLRGTLDICCSSRSVEWLLDEVARLDSQEPGLLRFEATLEFEAGMRLGFALLSRDTSERAAGEAALHLTRAAVLRPERADVHAYLAVALARLGSNRSEIEVATALELCPNLAQTRVGERLERLGYGLPRD